MAQYLGHKHFFSKKGHWSSPSFPQSWMKHRIRVDKLKLTHLIFLIYIFKNTINNTLIYYIARYIHRLLKQFSSIFIVIPFLSFLSFPSFLSFLSFLPFSRLFLPSYLSLLTLNINMYDTNISRSVTSDSHKWK